MFLHTTERNSSKNFYTNLVISARISLCEYPLPNDFLILRGHEYPFGNLDHGPTTTTTYIVEGRGTYRDAGGIGTFRQFVG